MSTPNRIRISPENGKRIAKIANDYSAVGLPRSWNAIGNSAVSSGLKTEEERIQSIKSAAKPAKQH